MQGWTGTSYFPHWMEISVTMSIVTVGFIAFAFAAKYLPLFKHEHPAPAVHTVPEHAFVEDLEMVSQGN